MTRRRLRLVEDLVALAGGELASKVVAFAAFAYLARTLGPEAYGSVELAVALALVFTLLVDFGLGPVGAREISRDPARAPDLAARIPAARLVLALVAAPAMIGLSWLTGQSAETLELCAYFAAGLIALPFAQRWLFQGLEMMPVVSGGQALRTLVFAIGIVIFVRNADDLLWVGKVEVAAASTLALYFAVAQRLRMGPLRLRVSFSSLRSLLREGSSVGLSQMVWATNQYLPVLMVGSFLGSAEVAFFGAAHRVALSLASFSWIYHFNLFPALSRSLGISQAAFAAIIEPSFRVIAWVGVAVGLCGTLLADLVVTLVYGSEFAAAGPVLAIAVWTIPATLLHGHARWALIAGGHQDKVLWAQLAGLVTTGIVAAAVIPVWGAPGAAAAMVLSHVAVWFVAQRYAVALVAPVPFAVIGRPLALAALTGGAVSLAELTPIWATLVAGAAFVALSPVVDRRLLSDALRLARAKGERGVAAPAPGVPS